MIKFKVGDRVVVDNLVEEDYDNCDEIFIMSTVGTIIHDYNHNSIDNNLYEVEFDEFIDGTDGAGYGKDGYCLALFTDQLNYYIQIDENKINSFLN